MRTFTTSCLAILLLAAFATARLGDPVGATETPSLPSSPSTTDVNNFLSGVWDSIGLGRDFDDFAACLEEDDKASTQLQKAMTLMNSSSASDVTKGLNKLDKVVSPLVAGLKACNMKDKYTATINKIVNTFTNPKKLNIQSGASIQINGVEVYPDVSAAITAYNAGKYATSGASMGMAMGNAFYGSEKVTSADQAAQINAIPNNTWTAGDFTQFQGMNLWQFKKNRVNLKRQKKEIADSNTENDDSRRNLAVTTIPTAFDARTKWPTCIQPIRNQQGCGSCWAFGASETLGDRFCIATNGTINKVMSPQALVSCDTKDFGCGGGYINYAWSFLEKTGDVTESCWPYTSGNGGVPACSTFTKCADNSTMRRYYAKTNSSKGFYGAAAIQAEILANGPVETGMSVYSDFMSYKSGIYTNTTGATFMGGHAIKIIGWGNTAGTNYWIVANSWGTTWGEAGFFRIKFGSCGIDSGAWAGLPDLTRS